MGTFMCLCFLTLLKTYEAQVHMSANVFVNENDSVPVTCNTTEPADIVTFFINHTRYATIFPKIDCQILHANVTCTCESLTVITCTTVILKRNDHRINVTFHAQYGSRRNSTSAVIHMMVPIKQVIISPEVPGDLFLNASDPMTSSCEALDGIPTPRIDWFLTNTTLSSTSGNFNVNITSSSLSEVVRNPDKTYSVASILTYIVNKMENGMWIYCSANNVENSHFLSRMIRLHVQYKPQEDVFINDQLMFANYYMIRISETVQMLKCSVHGGNPLANISWICYDGTQSENNTMSSAIRTVTWHAKNHNNSTCICKASHILGWTDQKAVNIHVYYKPYPPNCKIGDTSLFGDKVNVTLASDISITCGSDGNPPPHRFTWTLPSSDIMAEKTLTLSNVQTRQGGRYTISAENTMIPSLGPNVRGHSNTTLDIIVHYGPRNPLFYFASNGMNITSKTISIIKGEQIRIVCFADASPPPMYLWSNMENGQTVTQTFDDDTNISCTIFNTIYPTGNTARQINIRNSLQIGVLYPPSVPVLQFHSCIGDVRLNTTLFRIVSGRPLYVTCFAEASPEAEYRWHNSQSSKIFIANVSKSNSAEYVCNAKNTMKTSYGRIVEGLSEASFDLDVLYPPTITNSDVEFVVIEDTYFNLKCEVSPGNPDKTSVFWGISLHSKENTFENTISFQNISRTDEGSFTCVVNNTMRPTGCNKEYGIDTQQFHIDVQYKATIQRFIALNARVTHTEEISFDCDVDSDPPAYVSIVSTNGTILLSTSGDNQLRYRKASSCLEDIGNFSCNSANKHNGGSPDIKNVTVDVKCSPMYRPSTIPKKVVKSIIGGQTVLNFSIFSNPLPTTVIWTNLTNNMQLSINTSESERVFITTSDDMLSSVVVIKRTETWDFGNYSVRVENIIGSKIETFSIALHDEIQATADGRLASSESNSKNYGALIGGIVASCCAVLAAVVMAVFISRSKRKQRDEGHSQTLRKLPENGRYEELTSWSRRTDAVYTDLDMIQSNNNAAQEHTRYEHLNNLRRSPNGEYTDLGFNTEDNIKERTSLSEHTQYENLALNSTKLSEQELTFCTIDVNMENTSA